MRDVAGLGLAVVLLAWGLPRIAGVGWAQILHPRRSLSPAPWLLLTGLQLSALWAFTFTITAALPGTPGISHARALIVNLAGSLVVNTLPFGGAVAIAATYTICRSWRFSRSAIGISVLLGGVFAMGGKVLVPLVGLAALGPDPVAAGDSDHPSGIWSSTGRRPTPGQALGRSGAVRSGSQLSPAACRQGQQ